MASNQTSQDLNGDDQRAAGDAGHETNLERSAQMGVMEDEDETEAVQSVERGEDAAQDRPSSRQLPTGQPLNASEALPEFTRSGRHVRLAHDHAIPNQPRTIGSGADAGSNLMALFGDETTPRTMYNLVVEEGRAGNDAWRGYPPATRVIPARLTLEEICRWYPNHVWGTGLRLFASEGWKAKRIFENLPANARNHGAGSRPWNYLQARVLREKKALYEEQTKKKWNPVPKRPSAIASPNRNAPERVSAPATQQYSVQPQQQQPQQQPPLPRRRHRSSSISLSQDRDLAPPPFPFRQQLRQPQQSQPQPQQPPANGRPPPETELQRLERLTIIERTRVLNILIRFNQIQGVMFPRTTGEQQFNEHESAFVLRLNTQLARRVPGVPYWTHPIDIIRVLWQQDNFRDVAHNETMPDYMDRSNRAARRIYLANLRHWGVRWEQLIQQMMWQVQQQQQQQQQQQLLMGPP
ncbi:hypothetical protein PV08_06994 [Exophiala spinifera]|uniref:Uncharacterized protein n=1 Tax=Exophiala spinifera TaxID=91928 RepID=A0A0D2B5K3_9EURO|nr:uncharacterized protein PV08_06994 [Exophiala spinifera]KIW14213.1 hypothetical protein PV08_06994 [Exophiala spinifera]